jgi:hypothetical protein
VVLWLYWCVGQKSLLNVAFGSHGRGSLKRCSYRKREIPGLLTVACLLTKG